MDAVTETAEFDPYVANSLGSRVRFDIAYAGSWLLIGWTMARDGIGDAFAGRHHRLGYAGRTR